MADVVPSPPGPPPPLRFTISLYAFRVVATLQALLTSSQALSIGQYLNGSYAMIHLHATVAGICVLSALVLAVTAVLYVIAGGRVWVIGCVLLFLAEGVQTGMGYRRTLAVHIPLGVAILGFAVFLAAWSWTRGASRHRSRRTVSPAPQEQGVAA